MAHITKKEYLVSRQEDVDQPGYIRAQQLIRVYSLVRLIATL